MANQKPKYQLGRRIDRSPFIVRGILALKAGGHKYFVQIKGSDNTFVATEDELERAIAIVDRTLADHYAKRI